MNTTSQPLTGSESLLSSNSFPQEMSTIEVSPTCPLSTSKDTLNAIFLPESEAGLKHFNSQAGIQLDLFGQVAAPASHSVAQEINSEPMTSDTSGPLSLISSASAALQSSLANRLQVNLDVNGCPEYSLTWKEWDMPGREPICALRASGRHTSASESIGEELNGGIPSYSPPIANAPAETMTAQETAAATLSAQDAEANIRSVNAQDQLKMDTTTMSKEALSTLTGWVTPNTRDWKDTAGQKTHATNPDGTPRVRLDQAPRQAFQIIGTTSKPHISKEERPVAYSAEHSRWLMGYPDAWSRFADTGMP